MGTEKETEPRTDLVERLAGTLPAQFDAVVFRARVPPQLLSGTSQLQRAIEVVRYFQQPGMDIRVLEEAIAAVVRDSPPWPPPPAPPPHYIDRPDLVARLEGAMSGATGAVLVGLQGAGGVGKTTLAQVFAQRHGGSFARVVWVDVRTQGGSTEAVAGAVLAAFGDSAGSVRDVDDALARIGATLDEIERGDKRLLLVLDNADHPDDGFRGFVEALGGIGVRTLMTTRSRTLADALQGDAIDVGVFAEPEAVACLRAWMTDGGRLATPRVGDEAGLLAVVRRIGALPLAIKLAGAYLRGKRTVTLPDYLRELALPDLHGVGIDKSLAITLKSLDNAERTVLDACAACAAPAFSVESVARAADLSEDEVRVHVPRLHAWSLLDVAEEPGRYRLHPLVRERLRLASGFAAVAERHAERLLALLGPFTRELNPVEEVRDEVAAAVDGARERNDGDRLIAVCRRAEWYWRYRGPWTFAEEALAVAEAHARAGCDDNLSHLLFARSHILRLLGDWDSALALLEEKEQLDARRNAPLGRADALSAAGLLLNQRGEYARARVKLEETLHLQEEHNAPKWDIGVTLFRLGSVERDEAHYDAALAWYERSLEIDEYLNDIPGRAATLFGMAVAHASRGDHRTALELLDTSLAIRRRLNHPSDIAGTLHQKGNSHLALGEIAAAEACYAESLDLAREQGDTRWIAENLYRRAYLRRSQLDRISPEDQGRRAALCASIRALLAEALPLYDRMGQRDRATSCRALLAVLPAGD